MSAFGRREEGSEDTPEILTVEEPVLRIVSIGDVAEEWITLNELGKSDKRPDALILGVPSPFETTGDALEWVKRIQASEESLQIEELQLASERPRPWVPDDTLRRLPCLIVYAPPLEGYAHQERRDEETVRARLADEGVIVIEQSEREAGGCRNLEEIREMFGSAILANTGPIHTGLPAPATASDPIEAYFQTLREPPEGTEAYGRFPAHVEPTDEAGLEKQVEKAFERYDQAPWWELDY